MKHFHNACMSYMPLGRLVLYVPLGRLVLYVPLGRIVCLIYPQAYLHVQQILDHVTVLSSSLALRIVCVRQMMFLL